MPFVLKNVPLTYKHAVNMAFKEYFGVFMKVFLDHFNIFNDLKTRLVKLRLCFDKCRKFGINLNSKTSMFLVFFDVIFGYIMCKERKLQDPKKITTIVNMLKPKTPKDIQVFNIMAQFYRHFVQNFVFINYQFFFGKPKFFNGLLNVNMHGKHSSSDMWMHQSWLH